MSKPILKPVPDDYVKKRKRQDTQNLCIICEKPCEEDRSSYPEDLWHELKNLALKWKDLDRFGTVYDNVNWNAGSSGLFFHKMCKAHMANSRALMQAQKRNSNADEQENYVDDGNNKVCQSSSAGNSINSYFIKLYFIFHQYSYAYS